ncbi:MAG: ABC-2 family transporter protein [Anaerolineae bacterium]|nr:ABC-2 family transporter protein [Anaerolineae bacterium]
MYRRLIGVQIRSQLAYRTSFLLGLLSTAVGNVSEFLMLALVLARFEGIGDWALREIAFLYGMVSTAFGAMDLIFSGFDPQDFGRSVRRGTFDLLLLRPIDVTVQVMGSRFHLRRLGRIIQGAAVLIVALPRVRWTLLKVLYLPVVFASLILFYGALFMIGSTITFWTIQSIEAMNILTYGGTEMMAYPMHIYGRDLRLFFTYIVPAAFLNYYPALYYLDLPDPFGLPSYAPFLAPLVGVGSMAVALAFWRFGIRHYASTGT